MPEDVNSMSRTPLLVTGGEGMLGCEIARIAQNGHQFEAKSPGRSQLDVRDPQAMSRMSDWVAGGWIAHCAAIVDVEGCARDPDGARRTIVDGAIHAAKLAADSGARLFYPQSFLIYDGEVNPISELEEPRPMSLYGRLKWEAEQEILARVDTPLIVRMAGFFGGASKDKNFVGRILPQIHAAVVDGRGRFEVGDRIWQPTWTRDLAANTVRLMQAGASGRYQMACHGEATFHQVAVEIAVAMGWQDRIEIVRVASTQVSQNELGRRPDKAILDCARLMEEGNDIQRDWKASLHEYLQDEYFNKYRFEA